MLQQIERTLAIDPGAREMSLLDQVHAPAREAAPFIDEQVVHDARKPRTGLVDRDEIVEQPIRLDQEFLEKILGLGSLAREAEGEPVQAIEMRAYQALECLSVLFVTHGVSPALVARCMPPGCTDRLQVEL